MKFLGLLNLLGLWLRLQRIELLWIRLRSHLNHLKGIWLLMAVKVGKLLLKVLLDLLRTLVDLVLGRHKRARRILGMLCGHCFHVLNKCWWSWVNLRYLGFILRPKLGLILLTCPKVVPLRPKTFLFRLNDSLLGCDILIFTASIYWSLREHLSNWLLLIRFWRHNHKIFKFTP